MKLPMDFVTVSKDVLQGRIYDVGCKLCAKCRPHVLYGYSRI